jgi:hypothetical protein
MFGLGIGELLPLIIVPSFRGASCLKSARGWGKASKFPQGGKTPDEIDVTLSQILPKHLKKND